MIETSELTAIEGVHTLRAARLSFVSSSRLSSLARCKSLSTNRYVVTIAPEVTSMRRSAPEQMLTNRSTTHQIPPRTLNNHHYPDRLHATISCSGQGYESHSLSRPLFPDAFSVDRARSRDMGGTGLGLAIVKQLALPHARIHGPKCSEGIRLPFTCKTLIIAHFLHAKHCSTASACNMRGEI